MPAETLTQSRLVARRNKWWRCPSLRFASRVSPVRSRSRPPTFSFAFLDLAGPKQSFLALTNRRCDHSCAYLTRPPCTHCSYCGAAITFVWWQRFLIAGFTLFLTFVPISLRLRGTTLLFAAVLPVFPSLVVAIIIIFKTIPPKDVHKK
jgi:hypothetical protein